ncbi:MAG: hypothetical protein WAX07_00225 [Candidatus Altiarchaeia archaeon]
MAKKEGYTRSHHPAPGDLSKIKEEILSWIGPMPKPRIEQRLEQWIRDTGDASWDRSAAPLFERMRSMQKLLKKKDYPHPDDFFFSIEDLPYMGKEYWFLYFVVPGEDMQVVITTGRSQGPVQVNRSRVKKDAGMLSDEGTKTADCAAVCWMYSDRKEMLIDSAVVVGVSEESGRHRMSFRKGRNEMVMEGAYPRFDISLKKNGHAVFSVRATAQKKGTPWEMPPRLLDNPFVKGFGAVLVNYFFDYEGMMHDCSVKGKAYLQKVVATVPFTPWNWIRVQFKTGCVLDYFTVSPLGEFSTNRVISDAGYFEFDGKRFELRGYKLTGYMDGETKRWLLSGKDLYLSMESYSLTPFKMKHRTEFQYDEYLVRVKDFALRIGNRTYTLGDLGAGSGIVEDAQGYFV